MGNFLTYIIVSIPIIALALYRSAKPRFFYKDLSSGAITEPKKIATQLIIEGIVYLIVLYFLFPGFEIKSGLLITYFFIVGALAIWSLGHGIYFLKFKKQANSKETT